VTRRDEEGVAQGRDEKSAGEMLDQLRREALRAGNRSQSSASRPSALTVSTDSRSSMMAQRERSMAFR